MTQKARTDEALSQVMREDRGRLLAALIGQLRDFQLAEDCLQEAMTSALTHWQRTGVPRNPPAWLLQVARRKAIDRLRRASVAERAGAELETLLQLDQADAERPEIPDDRLRLIFTCCHPALDPKSRVALTLRTLGGLNTDEIARAFLDATPTMAQRLSRAKTKIRQARIPFAIPEGADLPERVQGVAQVIYLIFNEGYAVTQGGAQLRVDLCEEALFLSRMMVRLRPQDAEIEGLCALLLLTHARRRARSGADGAYVPLSEQDRMQWDRDMLDEGLALTHRALMRGRAGPYQLQAAIAALHGEAADHASTDWAQIAALYRLLCQMTPGPVTRLNAAVAQSWCAPVTEALTQVEALAGDLATYQPFHAARADLLERAGRMAAALDAYDAALNLTRVDSERRFLQRKRNGVATRADPPPRKSSVSGGRGKKRPSTKLGRSPTGRYENSNCCFR